MTSFEATVCAVARLSSFGSYGHSPKQDQSLTVNQDTAPHCRFGPSVAQNNTACLPPVGDGDAFIDVYLQPVAVTYMYT